MKAKIKLLLYGLGVIIFIFLTILAGQQYIKSITSIDVVIICYIITVGYLIMFCEQFNFVFRKKPKPENNLPPAWSRWYLSCPLCGRSD